MPAGEMTIPPGYDFHPTIDVLLKENAGIEIKFLEGGDIVLGLHSVYHWK